MELKDLIGYELESIDDDKIIVSKDDKKYTLKIEQDEGDCCGYNSLETELLIDKDDKPIITNVIENEESIYDRNTKKITFYGTNKELATLDSLSSSGSGWWYGACVSIVCKELNINETITSW